MFPYQTDKIKYISRKLNQITKENKSHKIT